MILINQTQQNKNIKKVLEKNPKSKPELKPKFGESIEERTKLRKQRLKEIAKKEKTIDNNLLEENFEYSSPNDIWKNLNTTSDIEEKNPKVNKRKNNLTDLMMKFKNNPTNNAKKKNRNRNKLVEMANLILEFNQID